MPWKGIGVGRVNRTVVEWCQLEVKSHDALTVHFEEDPSSDFLVPTLSIRVHSHLFRTNHDIAARYSITW